MTLLQVALLGAVIGLPLGYAMQRTNLCFNSAYHEALLRRNTLLLRGILLALLVQMVGLALVIQFGVGGVSLNVVPFFWLAAIVGGFIFGIPMIYAEGCSSTVWYRVGNGNVGALVTLIGFALGEAATSFRAPAWAARVAPGPGDHPEGRCTAYPAQLGISVWFVILLIVLIGGWWLWRGRPGSYLEGWDWRRAGLILGIIGAAAWLVAWPTGWHYGVGIVGATGPWVLALSKGPQVLNWGSFMMLALPVGAFMAAWRTKQLRWQVPNISSTLRMGTAGLVMCISATLARGCNIGHTYTGVPTPAFSSLTATLFIFLGAWFGNYLRFMRPQRVKLYGLEEA